MSHAVLPLERAYVGLDLGTSRIKALAADARGRAAAVEIASYPLLQPRPGWAEQRPDDWWAAACDVLHRLLARPELDGCRIEAIGLSGQMHGAVLLDASGRVLRPALTWADGRGADALADFARLLPPQDLLTITGSLPYASSTLAKLLWLRAHEPDVYRLAAHLLLPKDELRRRLTGAYATDPTDASGTQLYDVAPCAWSSRIIAALDLDPVLLPPVLDSWTASQLSDEAAEATGMLAGTPVATGAGDAECAALGVGLAESAEEALVSIGTAGQIFAILDTPRIDPHGRVQTLCYLRPGQWHAMGAILAAGHAFAWLAGTVGVSAAEIGALLDEAQTVPPGANGLLFLPYLFGERTPHMDPTARAAFVGLTASHTRAHLARAVVEGVGFALRDALEAFRTLGIAPRRALLAGGPAGHPLWRQVISDALALPVTVSEVEHGSALGAARLAARACGVELYDEPDDPARDRDAPARVATLPQPATVALYDRLYALYRPLYSSLRETFRALSAEQSGADEYGR
jgi:xylulokinase